VAVQISHGPLFTWSAHYLRNQDVIPNSIEYPSFPILYPLAPDPLRQALTQAEYLIADGDHDGCLGPPVWRHALLRLYKTPGGVPAIVTRIGWTIERPGLLRLDLAVFAVRAGHASIGFDIQRLHAGGTAPQIAARSSIDETSTVAADTKAEVALKIPAGASNLEMTFTGAMRGLPSAIAMCLR
jgi:hypothetical protein